MAAYDQVRVWLQRMAALARTMAALFLYMAPLFLCMAALARTMAVPPSSYAAAAAGVVALLCRAVSFFAPPAPSYAPLVRGSSGYLLSPPLGWIYVFARFITDLVDLQTRMPATT